MWPGACGREESARSKRLIRDYLYPYVFSDSWDICYYEYESDFK